MAVQEFILMTASEKDAATELDNDEQRLGARAIDNPLSDKLGLGDMVGKWVAPARLLDDPAYVRWVPTLGILPVHVLDSETVFNPNPVS